MAWLCQLGSLFPRLDLHWEKNKWPFNLVFWAPWSFSMLGSICGFPESNSAAAPLATGSSALSTTSIALAHAHGTFAHAHAFTTATHITHATAHSTHSTAHSAHAAPVLSSTPILATAAPAHRDESCRFGTTSLPCEAASKIAKLINITKQIVSNCGVYGRYDELVPANTSGGHHIEG